MILTSNFTIQDNEDNHHCFFRFEERETAGSRSFFTEIIASISDIKFGQDGRYILSRDYMTLKVPPFRILQYMLVKFSSFM